MTLRLNETVIVYDNYHFVTLQDFEVVFKKNSDEDAQGMIFQIVNITATEILVKLTFEKPMLISQGREADQVTVKLNKDLFLVPQRFATIPTVKDEQEPPFFVLTG